MVGGANEGKRIGIGQRNWEIGGMVVKQCSGGRGASPPHRGGWGGGGAGTKIAYVRVGHTCAQLADIVSASFNPSE